jgi:hypothetical protein
VSPVKYEQGFYIPEDDILYSHRRENLKSYIGFPFSIGLHADSSVLWPDRIQELRDLVLSGLSAAGIPLSQDPDQSQTPRPSVVVLHPDIS